MPPATRTVRRLRLEAPAEADARRTAVKLEDALRVATLPYRAGCVLLIRRIALPPVAADASPQSLALALEHAIERTRPEWVHGGAPDAARASVVWFADALDAHLHAAARVVAGAPLDAWFWPLAVPALVGESERIRQLRRIGLSLADREEAATALPIWIDRVIRDGGLDLLRAAFTQADVKRFARAMSVRLAGRVDRPESADASPAVDVGQATFTDDRGGGSRRLTPPIDDLLRAIFRVRAGDARLRSLDVRPLPVHPSAAIRSALGGTGASSKPFGADHSTLGASVRLPAPTPARIGIHGPATLLRERPHPNAPILEPLEGAWTEAGGLLFLLAVLRELGYPQWLTAHPGWKPHDPARRLLRMLLGRMRVHESDPAWSLVEQASVLQPVPWRFVAPDAWSAVSRPGSIRSRGRVGYATDASGRLLLGAWLGAPPRAIGSGEGLPSRGRPSRAAALPWRSAEARLDAVSDAWAAACRRWSRLRVGIGLASLVLRPAWLTTTATHVNLTLDLANTDIRLRRAGLDLDPGWLDWFGRVVTFHYEPMLRRGDAGA